MKNSLPIVFLSIFLVTAMSSCGRCGVSGDCGTVTQTTVDNQINNNSSFITTTGKKEACDVLIKSQAWLGNTCSIKWQ